MMHRTNTAHLPTTAIRAAAGPCAAAATITTIVGITGTGTTGTGMWTRAAS
ncbi:hypothetical protein [Luteimonas sp. RC10]|uniref:hypothetical protein n=1 Tax=Luteimonas sp. RC10 TaxID=2587035 RepID=UPI0016183925|nr:hypothetical protein [Luteimonas sp. RC10]MBB3342189.1 hypothetical protein [Luteimonas sp. RC10]